MHRQRQGASAGDHDWHHGSSQPHSGGEKIHQLPGTMQVSKKDGMQTMDMALLDIVARGLVTKDEAQSRSSNPNLFRRRQRGFRGALSLINQTHICEVRKC